MRKIDFLIILIALLIGLTIGLNIQSEKDRYQIVKTDNNTILLDKRTGLTWRNVWTDEKDKIMAYWEEMDIIINNPDIDSVPIGKENLKANFSRVKRNIEKMKSLNAPESEIKKYIESEGVVIE